MRAISPYRGQPERCIGHVPVDSCGVGWLVQQLDLMGVSWGPWPAVGLETVMGKLT